MNYPTIISACIGAIAALAAAFVGYRIGERQHDIEHKKLLSGLIVNMSSLPSEKAKGTASSLYKSSVFNQEDAEMLCRVFDVKCTPPAPKK
jgi:hypothetical protein